MSGVAVNSNDEIEPEDRAGCGGVDVESTLFLRRRGEF